MIEAFISEAKADAARPVDAKPSFVRHQQLTKIKIVSIKNLPIVDFS